MNWYDDIFFIIYIIKILYKKQIVKMSIGKTTENQKNIKGGKSIMAMVNTEVILNSNPTKKLRIAFNKLKENYTEENAKSYSELYKDKPLKFIIENSRYIFSEPYCGYSFYKEHVIENPYALLFTEYAGEREKILNYIEDSTNKIPDEQKKLYDFLCSVVEKKCTDSCSTALILKHGLLNESVRTDYDLLIESVYKLSQTVDKHDLNND